MRGPKLALFAVPLLALFSCTAPQQDPGDFMMLAESCPTEAPADQALVFIHRPREMQGHGLYYTIWLNNELIADIGNGQTAYVLLEPGEYRFVGRSTEVKNVVHAELLAGEIYDLVTDTAGFWVASFRLKPMGKDDELREELPTWKEEHFVVTMLEPPSEELLEYIDDTRPKVAVILEEAGQGELETFELGPDDHR